MTVKAAVFGAGNMGRHHARVLASMPEVELVAVVDPDLDRARALASAWGATGIASQKDLGECEVAVVAVPTPSHAEIAIPLVERGIHVLIEKPIAVSREEADEIIAAAAKARVTIAVGHVERFNPAVAALARLSKDPVFMQFERLSPYTPRIGDSVVFDLMVHDLDLACMLAGAEPDRVSCEGARVFSDQIDIATAVLRFPSGCVASLSASRATQDKIRRIALSEPERFIEADCLRQDICIRRETVSEYLDDERGTYRQASVSEIPYIDRRAEPLALELQDFVEAALGLHSPRVTGEAGALAVDLARRVELAAE